LFPDEAFNIELSPKKALGNNSAYLHSILDQQDSGFIKFQSGEKNSLLTRTLAGVTTTENADLPIFNLNAKLFRPDYVTFKTAVNINLIEVMRLTPYQKVSFPYNGYTIKGYLWDGGQNAADEDAQTWKLLLAPETDLTNLI
jgi:hypothetical protein